MPTPLKPITMLSLYVEGVGFLELDLEKNRSVRHAFVGKKNCRSVHCRRCPHYYLGCPGGGTDPLNLAWLRDTPVDVTRQWAGFLR